MGLHGRHAEEQVGGDLGVRPASGDQRQHLTFAVGRSGPLFVVPSLSMLLPPLWDERVYAVMLPNLAGQLAGTVPDAPLSPLGAAVTMLGYVVLALAAGVAVLRRRDA